MKINWKCDLCNATKTRSACPGRIVTNGFYAPVRIVTEHNHFPDETKMNRVEVIESIKERARTTREAPRNIIVDVEQNLDKRSASNMPSMQSLQAIITRERNRANIVSGYKDPTDLLNIELPSVLTKTNNDEQFLYYDSGVYTNKKSNNL